MDIDALDEAARAALSDRSRLMPEVVREARRLMRDRDPVVRTRAVAVAWFAVRQMLAVLDAGERVALCDAVSVDLELALAAGLVAPQAMLGGALRGVLHRVREYEPGPRP